MKIKQGVERKNSPKFSEHYSKLKDLDKRLEEFLYKAFITRELGYKFLHIGGLLALSMSVPKLAAMCGCSRTPINTWLKKMVEAGYIERRWNRGYQRYKDCQIIILTKKGKEFIKPKFRKPAPNLSRGSKKIFSQKNGEFRDDSQNLSRDPKKIFSQKILDEKCNDEIYQSEINKFINNKSILGAIHPGSRTFRRYDESKCARGWRIFEEITGQHQRITARGMRFLHRTMNELAKGLNAESTEAQLDVLRQFIRNQCSYLKEKTLYNIFNLRAIKLFIKRKWKQIYELEEKTVQSVKEWGHSVFDELKEKYHLKEVNRPAKNVYQTCVDRFNPNTIDKTTILIDNSIEKQTVNEQEEGEKMYNGKYRKHAQGYTEPVFYEGFNIEDKKRELLDAYNAKFCEALARPTRKQPKINTQDDLEAAKLRYTRLLKNLV
jgi:DNA-binding MarR family transcriptional regulator